MMRRKDMLFAAALIAFSVSLPVCAAKAPVAEPARIIIDADTGETEALAVLHALADIGEAEVLAVSLSSADMAERKRVDDVNASYGRFDVPVAAGADAVKTLRRVLSLQRNKSVEFVGVGSMANLRALLDSPPDEYSKYDGRALVSWKTKRLVGVGRVCPKWPTEAVAAGDVEGCRSGAAVLTAVRGLAPSSSEAEAAIGELVQRKPLCAPRFRVLKCNNPNAVYWAKGGVFGKPAVGDFCGTGAKDIALWDGWVNKEPWSGAFLLRNISRDGGTDPLFAPAERMGEHKAFDIRRYRDRDGNWIDRASIHPEPMRFNAWQEADFDGDGVVDIVASVGDGKDNGFWTHDNWSRDGKWLRCEGNGYIYVMKGLGGEGSDARFAPPEMLKLKDGSPLYARCITSTLIHDWDGDGDLDLIVYDFTDTIMYFENTGTRTNPVYGQGRLLKDAQGERLHGELCLPSAIATDWDGDGKTDMLFTEEDARVGWFRNAGEFVDGLPVFEKPRYLRGHQEDVWFGSLSTPYAFDWDGDGDEDIICGNAAGQIAFIENLSGPRVASPKWAPPVLLEAPPHLPIVGCYSEKSAPEPIWIQAGYNGSIQGPNEAKWGYVCLTVADWDGDGLPDIMANNIWGKLVWWRNVGTRAKPRLAAAQGVEVEWEGEQPGMKDGWYQPRVERNPRELIIPWRTTPMMTDWNGDGLIDLVALDHEGYLCLYERSKKDGRLVVLPPRRVFWDDARGIALHPAYGPEPDGWKQGREGGRGRRKMALCDWDGDGRTDVVMNGDHNAVVYRQTGFRDGLWHFACGQPLDPLTEISSHDPQPAVCDFDGDGVPDLLLGVIDGRIYHFENPRTNQKEH